ncbi:uncharacterized protein [Anabrus simplex]|uniref:uncharacterized protein isoform X2 n=1 Tax=Anabrus simplex TaxID=316456 RepID=UPI0034DD5BBC
MNAIIVLVAIFGFTYASAQSCQCTGFFTSDITEGHAVYNILENNDISCNRPRPCAEYCLHTLTQLTHDGDMSYEYQGSTIRDHICKNYNRDIQNGEVAAYFRQCNGPWQLLQTAKERICCKNGSAVSC